MPRPARDAGPRACGPDRRSPSHRPHVDGARQGSGLGVRDLIDLDLAYSPPYGQAKDPVNLAGMIGENLLDGTLRLWYAGEVDEVLESALVLDVRSPAEYATGHLPGSLNVPHTQVREHLPEIRRHAAGRPVRVLCASGVRSYLAHRALAGNGFDSASLSGGIITLRATLGEHAEELLAPEGTP